ncbi:MAG: L-serine ammonia-lyase, iron-sulfur-dependent, subunit alpha [Tissierellia bacterium]|nr:L-serine ammonia-lyase, iron-sulfur-dependent, subunit alpha [Tissierellia bacterium]
MYATAKRLIEECEKNKKTIGQIVLEGEMEKFGKTREEIRNGLFEMLDTMEESSKNTLDGPADSGLGIITGFAHKMNEYSKGNTLTGSRITKAMALSFSTFETNAAMGKIVASPTAGSSGILPAALMIAKEELGANRETLLEGMLTAVGIGQMIGMHATFAGAEGGCQAECGSAAAMAAGALISIMGGSPKKILEGASIALVNVLGLVCDPIGGFVEYPCTFRNASGVINAMISADLAMAGTYSVIPFDEVCIAMGEVGHAMNENLRETGTGGLAATKTGIQIREEFFKEN